MRIGCIRQYLYSEFTTNPSKLLDFETKWILFNLVQKCTRSVHTQHSAWLVELPAPAKMIHLALALALVDVTAASAVGVTLEVVQGE